MKKLVKYLSKKIYYWAELHVCLMLETLFSPKKTEYKKIPIIINNYNRLNCMIKLIKSLEDRGYRNIYIIDNASTYPPLLEFYKNCKYKIYYLKKNFGYLALWKTEIYIKFINDYYVYTDPDVVPIEECPENFLEYFLNIHKKYKNARKVGFSLKIDDLPDHYKNKAEVIEWEKQFWINKNCNNLYISPIDTTFALYKPWSWGGANSSRLSFRTDTPYSARHLPWYADSKNLSEEEKYYQEMASIATHWTSLV